MITCVHECDPIEAARRITELRGPTRPFELGKHYMTNDNTLVQCTAINTMPHYETAVFDDNIWRYNRDQDRGRVTGSAFDHSHPKCVIPESAL